MAEIASTARLNRAVWQLRYRRLPLRPEALRPHLSIEFAFVVVETSENSRNGQPTLPGFVVKYG